MNDPEYDLEERLLDYGADVIRLVERMPRTPAGSHVAGQFKPPAQKRKLNKLTKS